MPGISNFQHGLEDLLFKSKNIINEGSAFLKATFSNNSMASELVGSLQFRVYILYYSLQY